MYENVIFSCDQKHFQLRRCCTIFTKFNRSHLSNLSTLMYFMTSGCQGQEIWRPLLRLASNQHVRNSALRADIGHSAHPGRNREYTRRTSPPWTWLRTKSGLEPSGSKGLRVHNTSRNGKCRDWPLKSAFGSKLSLANACLNQAQNEQMPIHWDLPSSHAWRPSWNTVAVKIGTSKAWQESTRIDKNQ